MRKGQFRFYAVVVSLLFLLIFLPSVFSSLSDKKFMHVDGSYSTTRKSPNIIVNGDLESIQVPGNLGNWQVISSDSIHSGVLTRATDAYSGSYSGLFTVTANPITGGFVALSESTLLWGIGQTYELTFYYKSSLSSCYAQVFCKSEQTSTGFDIAYWSSANMQPSNVWTKVTVTFGPIPDGTQDVQIHFGPPEGITGTFQVDDISTQFASNQPTVTPTPVPTTPAPTSVTSSPTPPPPTQTPTSPTPSPPTDPPVTTAPTPIPPTPTPSPPTATPIRPTPTYTPPTPTPTPSSPTPPAPTPTQAVDSSPTVSPTPTVTSDPSLQQKAEPTPTPTIPELSAGTIFVIIIVTSLALGLWKRTKSSTRTGKKLILSATKVFIPILLLALIPTVVNGQGITPTATPNAVVSFSLWFTNGTAIPTDGRNVQGFQNGGMYLNVGGITCIPSGYGSSRAMLTNVIVLRNDGNIPINISLALTSIVKPSNIEIFEYWGPMSASMYQPYSNNWMGNANLTNGNPVAPGKYLWMGITITLAQPNIPMSGTPNYNFDYSFNIEVTASPA